MTETLMHSAADLMVIPARWIQIAAKIHESDHGRHLIIGGPTACARFATFITSIDPPAYTTDWTHSAKIPTKEWLENWLSPNMDKTLSVCLINRSMALTGWCAYTEGERIPMYHSLDPLSEEQIHQLVHRIRIEVQSTLEMPFGCPPPHRCYGILK